MIGTRSQGGSATAASAEALASWVYQDPDVEPTVVAPAPADTRC